MDPEAILRTALPETKDLGRHANVGRTDPDTRSVTARTEAAFCCLTGGIRAVFERFTDRARRVVVLAQEEARLLNHNYIGTEHILLGLLREGEGVAARVLKNLDVH